MFIYIYIYIYIDINHATSYRAYNIEYTIFRVYSITYNMYHSLVKRFRIQ